MAEYLHTCSDCKKTYSRNVNWMDPKFFKDPKNARKTESFWCPKCSLGQLVVVALLPDNKVELIDHLEHKSIIKEDSIAFTKEGESTEDISLDFIANDINFEM